MTAEDSPTKEDTDWFPVLITEFLVILIINTMATTAFARIRHLRKRSTYLIMNLTVADLLVGVVTGPLRVYLNDKDDQENNPCTLPGFIICAIEFTFPIASQVNLSLISLARLHATLFPFRHCFLTKWIYVNIIIACWFITFLLAFAMAILSEEAFGYAWASFSAVTLLVLMVSYIIIIVTVQSNPHSHNNGLIHTERKLPGTLFLVTGVSVLTILPWVIYESMPEDIKERHERSYIDSSLKYK